jgi:hypothetical protein
MERNETEKRRVEKRDLFPEVREPTPLDSK